MEINEIKKQIEMREYKKGVCEIANDNADGQVIISGDKDDVQSFQDFLKIRKIKCIPLKVSAPFHCTLMKPAAEIMKDKISKTIFKKPLINIINNVTAKSETQPDKIKELLVEQICSTVKWRESIVNISKDGITNFVEIGPGKILTGMVKRTLKNSNCFSINTIADIKNTDNEFKK